MSTKTNKATKRTSKPRTIEVVEDAPTTTRKKKTSAAAEPPAASPAPVATDAKPAAKKRKAAETSKKLSALDAAAQVLKSGGAMNAKEMVGAMSAQGLWTSPGGKTPHATLYSAILREINAKGNESRFVKTERGKFAAR